MITHREKTMSELDSDFVQDRLTSTMYLYQGNALILCRSILLLSILFRALRRYWHIAFSLSNVIASKNEPSMGDRLLLHIFYLNMSL